MSLNPIAEEPVLLPPVRKDSSHSVMSRSDSKLEKSEKNEKSDSKSNTPVLSSSAAPTHSPGASPRLQLVLRLLADVLRTQTVGDGSRSVEFWSLFCSLIDAKPPHVHSSGPSPASAPSASSGSSSGSASASASNASSASASSASHPSTSGHAAREYCVRHLQLIPVLIKRIAEEVQALQRLEKEFVAGAAAPPHALAGLSGLLDALVTGRKKELTRSNSVAHSSSSSSGSSGGSSPALMDDSMSQAVLNAFLSVRSLILQRTKLSEECAATLLSIVKKISSDDDRRSSIRAYVTALQQPHHDTRTPIFILEELCNLIVPKKVEKTCSVVLKRVRFVICVSALLWYALIFFFFRVFFATRISLKARRSFYLQWARTRTRPPPSMGL
jgi:hypothetical protein